MYAALWRVMPGPWWVRLLLLVVLAGVVLAALAFWVFPWIDSLLVTEVTVGEAPTGD
ncbi:hypothetical protein [Diaminobutyricimonas sp. LJ205]|uniref:hypothetical protein n=1 Tax=Diaminobutyricimonas sp. LJ205 TaxID=2683590 RepID=UPI0018DFBA57|nr:hypothetical protein [Diaminobutyricimonas sp. LJ205]